MGMPGGMEWVLIALVVLLLFGGKKIPELAKGLGSGIKNFKNAVKEDDVKNISVIGGGFIGIETVENLKEAGYNVTLIEAMPQILRILDFDMVQILHKEIFV